MTLKESLLIVRPMFAFPEDGERCWSSTRRMVSIATSVLP